MFWRAVATTICWFLGMSQQMADGQAFRNALTLLAAAAAGSLPWIPLARGNRGTRGRNIAIVVVVASAILIVLIAIGLPEAYRFQMRFNEETMGR